MPTLRSFLRRAARRPEILALGLALLLTAGWLLAGCQEDVAEPVYDNIFDPLNPDSADPLNVRLSLGDTTITVIWDYPAGFDIASYEILHSLDPAQGFSSVGEVETIVSIPPVTVGVFIFKNPAPTSTHYFKVLAHFADGYRTLVSAVAPLSILTPPLVIAGGGGAYSATRYIDLKITVSTEEFLRISSTADFSDPLEVAVVAPGSPQIVPWDLGTAAVNLEEKVIHVVAFTGGAFSDTAVVDLKARFQPTFKAVGGPASVATRLLDLEIAATGVLQMRFAPSEAALAGAAWVPGAFTYSGFELQDSLNPQTIYGEFAGDFGFNHIAHYTAVPDDLADAAFHLDLPASNITDEVNVACVCSAVATQMRFAETPSFVGVPWQDYAPSALFTLTPEEGAKTVYAQFRNDWTESAVLTDQVIYVVQPLDVSFTAPQEGDEVEAGATLQLRGVSTAGSGTLTVDLVKVDTGDGAGFQPAAGTAEWTYWWEIPEVELATERTLRARAYSGTDSVTAVVNVSVVPAGLR